LPIHLRAREVADERKEKLERLKFDLEGERIKKDPESYAPSFKPSINEKSEVLSMGRRHSHLNFNKFAAKEENWKNKREMSRLARKEEQL
jgi:hypothetical protein